MSYRQVTLEERYTLATLRAQVPRPSNAEIARIMGRHRSTISRELRRNSARHDGAYRYTKAQERTNGRRSRSRRNSHFSSREWRLIEKLLRDDLSPEQVSGKLRRDGVLSVSHETIYQHIWRDKFYGGRLYRGLRQSPKRRKRYGTYEKRGRVTGKRHITERPAAVEARQELGHWEMDTVIGAGSKDCIVTLVERVSGVTLIGKLRDRTVAELNRVVLRIIRRHRSWFETITVDNGTEFHGYAAVERITGVLFYFATPYHSWERGTNENTNGLIRQYLPKRKTMSGVKESRCNAIARKLNNRPRKRHGFLSPLEVQKAKEAQQGRRSLTTDCSASTTTRRYYTSHVSVAVQT